MAARYHFSRRADIRKNAAAEAAALAMAQAMTAMWKPLISVGPLAPRTPPRSAVATKPPVRAMALLKPEAEPVWRVSTAPSTALVSGATAPDMPTEITRMAGSTWVQ